MQAANERHSRLGKVVLVLTLALVANSAYLAAYGDPTLFYVANSLIHPFLGIIIAILFTLYLARHRSDWTGSAGRAAGVLLALGTIFGIYLIFVGMTRPNAWALYAHVALTIAGLFFLLIHLRRLLAFRRADAASRDGGPLREGKALPYQSAWRWSVAVIVMSAALYGAATLYHRLYPNPRYVVRNPQTPPLTMEEEGGGENSFMFPSSVETPDNKPIKPDFFMNSESCKRCHEDIFRQWSSSMHRFASFNNQWYRKSIEYMQDVNGIKSTLWCGGCHDHALILAGKMQQRHIREMIHLPESQAGLGCMSCHAITEVKSTMGQGDFVIEYPALAEYAATENRFLRWLHDFQVKLNPKPHRNAFLKPFHKATGQGSEFCSTCHKVHLDVPVNNYRWIRGFNDYDNWQASGVSGQGARSFYYPPKAQQCADCHMPLEPSKDFGNINGFVHSHRFAAANTAVPVSHGDHEQVREVEKFLKGAVSVDIFALAEEPPEEQAIAGPAGHVAEGPQLASTFAVGEESAAGLAGVGIGVGPPAKLMAPLGRAAARVRPGDTVRVEVVVRTRRVGHFFPAGTVDAFDVWVELQARDSKGRIIYWSGKVEDDGRGPVEPGAHFYRSLQLDAHGNPINKRNAWATRAVMYARLIPPGAADTAHFRLKVPEDVGDTITLTARLNYRKFAWWNTQWAFAGIPDPLHAGAEVTKSYDDRPWIFAGDLSSVSARRKEIPNVPIVVIAEAMQTVPVAPTAPAFEEIIALDSSDRERWNDYGIGLLLQGDLKGAERTFLKVTQLEPTYADGWVNVARARIQEGNIDAARPMLQKALDLNPRLGSAYYFSGLALKADGKYAEAYNAFSKAAALYPRDRVVRNQMGRMLFLQRKYREAVAEFRKTLEVDPEDLEAHYNLMLCYRGLRDDASAAREEKLYLRFKADESARAITGPYKLKNPHDNNEAQPIHTHASVPLERLTTAKRYGSVAATSQGGSAGK